MWMIDREADIEIADTLFKVCSCNYLCNIKIISENVFLSLILIKEDREWRIFFSQKRV